MKLRIGLIGLSKDWSQRHLPALRLLRDRFEVIGIYSSVSSIADNASREFGAESFSSYRDMLRSEDVDAVLFLEDAWYGTMPIRAACDYGKAIYCGSQVAMTFPEANGLKNIVDQSGVAFMSEFPKRYAPASLRLKELIATRLGKPKLLFCHRRLSPKSKLQQRASSSIAERHDRELVELIDWCSFVVGSRVRSIQGVRHTSNDGGHSDYESLSLDLSGDDDATGSTIAQISCGSYISPAWPEAITIRPPAALQVCCENGMAFLDLPSSLIWFDEAGGHQESLDAELAVGQQLLSQFHRAITSLVRKMGDLEDLCQGLAALAAVRSQTDSAIKISDFHR